MARQTARKAAGINFIVDEERRNHCWKFMLPPVAMGDGWPPRFLAVGRWPSFRPRRKTEKLSRSIVQREFRSGIGLFIFEKYDAIKRQIDKVGAGAS